MAIDWNTPNAATQKGQAARPPTLDVPHPTASTSLSSAAALDQALTERNAAVAEAKLWLRRMLDMQRERDQARLDLMQARQHILDWQTAYDELQAHHTEAHRVVDFIIASRADAA